MSIDTIYDYLEAGFRVFQLHTIKDGACGCGDPRCQAVGKHPQINSWQTTPRWTEQQIDNLIEYDIITTGFGVCIDDQLVIDIDPRNGGNESFDKMVEASGIDFVKESDFVVNTGGGGRHIYFARPPGSFMQHLPEFPGIDFKTSGFVVGAGSLHASGLTYDIDKGNPCDMNQAPAGLVAKLKREPISKGFIDGEEMTVSDEQMADMLRFINPDGDYEEWVQIGMALHHATSGTGLDLWDAWSSKGEKYKGIENLDRHWQSFGKHGGDPITLATLARHAENGGWIAPVTFEGSAEIQESTIVAVPKREKLLDMLLADDDVELNMIAAQPWLIDDVIPGESFGIMYGPSGTGKSFAALDKAMHIAAGMPWQGFEGTSASQVVYISAEGGRGLRVRKRAWEQIHGKRVPNMRVLPTGVLLDNDKDRADIKTAIKGLIDATGQQVSMIVVDTLARSMAGDENTVKDSSMFIRGCDELKELFGCTILVVHHTGKDEERGARGSSAFKAASDFEISISGSVESVVRISCTKSKDAAPFKDVTLKMESVELDGLTDHKNRPLRTLVPVAATFGDIMRSTTKLKGKDQALMDIVDGMEGEITQDELRKNFYCHSDNSTSSQEAKKKAFSRSLKQLESMGYIRIFDDKTVQKIGE